MKTPVTLEDKIDYIYYQTKRQNRNSGIITIFKTLFYGAVLIFLILSLWTTNREHITQNLRNLTQPFITDIAKDVSKDIWESVNEDLKSTIKNSYIK